MDNYQGPGIYRHFKGGEYEVFALGADEETLDTGNVKLMVAYKPVSIGARARYMALFGTDTILRSIDSFDASVAAGEHGDEQPRFQKIRDRWIDPATRLGSRGGRAA